MSSVEHPSAFPGVPPAARVLCACAEDPEAPGAPERLRGALAAVGDWDGLGAVALRHGMAALLYRRVADLCPDAAPPEVLAVWRERAFEIAQVALRMQRRLVRLAAGLAAAGVPVMAMKGPALSEQLYGDANLRTFSDLDLLVSSADVARAREAVLAAGYQDVHPLAAVSPDRLLEVMQEIVVRDPTSGTIVELHWREGPRFAADSLPAEELAGRATSVELLGRHIAVPGLPDVALLVAVHAATHDWQRFEDVAALAAAVRRLTVREAGELEALALAHACRRRLHVGALLVTTLAGVSPPPAIRAAATDDRVAKDLAAFYGARLLWDMDAAAVHGAAFGRTLAGGGRPTVRAAEILREARGLDSRRAAAGYVRRRLLTPGVNDWEWPDGGSDSGAGAARGPGGRSAARRAMMTQVRRQRRMWRGSRRPATGLPPAPTLYHAFTTRFAVRSWAGAPLPSDEWLRQRFELFERYCLPSVKAQSSTGFEWLLFYDSGIGGAWIERLQGYAADWPAIVPVGLEAPWGREVVREAVAGRLPAGARLVLTSRLDNDDALAVDYVARLLRGAGQVGEGAVVFDWGINLVGADPYVQPLLRGPFVSRLARVGAARRVPTVWDYEHEQYDDVMPVLHLALPFAWVRVVHGRNLSNRRRGVRVPRRWLAAGFAPLALDAEEPESTADFVVAAAASGRDFAASLASDRRRARRALRFLASRTVPGAPR